MQHHFKRMFSMNTLKHEMQIFLKMAVTFLFHFCVTSSLIALAIYLPVKHNDCAQAGRCVRSQQVQIHSYKLNETILCAYQKLFNSHVYMIFILFVRAFDLLIVARTLRDFQWQNCFKNNLPTTDLVKHRQQNLRIALWKSNLYHALELIEMWRCLNPHHLHELMTCADDWKQTNCLMHGSI